MSRARNQVLRGILRKLVANPFPPDQLEALHALLSREEAELEALGPTLAAERADVDALDAPLTRALLWVTGRLASTEARERSEYDAVMHDVMQRGARIQPLREALESLGPPVRRIDVAHALEGLSSADLAEWPHLDLQPLLERTHRASELDAISALCRSLLGVLGRAQSPRRDGEAQQLVARIVQRLEGAGEGVLVGSLEAVPSGDRSIDLACVREVRTALEARTNALRDGLDGALRDLVLARWQARVGITDRTLR
ncbi:MAG: hypothetical protein R3F61_02795 [Myxococcota bacterium]